MDIRRVSVNKNDAKEPFVKMIQVTIHLKPL